MGKHVNIVGAGLCGSLMAIFLARRGFQVTVFEKRPDPRRVELPAGRSINLALANRGLRPLRAVGLQSKVQDLLTTMRGRMVHDRDGHTELQRYGQRPWEVIYSVSRPGLNALLMDEAEAAGAELVFEQSATGADLAHDQLRLYDESNGQSFTTRLTPTVAADGAGSPLRQALMQRPGYECSVEFLSHRYKELRIPATQDGDFAMEPEALHIWPRGGFMLIALPNLDHSFTVTLFLPQDGNPGFAQLTEPAAVRRFFEAEFPDALGLIPDLEEAFNANPTGELGTVRCHPWHRGGQLCLIGDAAHAIVPFHGQGMNCAFEDCLALDACIEETGGDWSRAFALLTERRKRNADAIADMALENYVEMRDSVRDPGFLLRQQVAFELERRHPGRFVRRYGLVMFRDDIGYAEAQARGRIQSDILARITAGKRDLAECDLDVAAPLIRERLTPLS
jgi:kynurenine 3-monooxygenase